MERRSTASTSQASGHRGPCDEGRRRRAGAFLRLLDDHDDFTVEVVTDSEGIFRFTARDGHWTVRALAPGGLSGQSSADVAKGCINQADIALG